jgi:cold shock CspA family protein
VYVHVSAVEHSGISTLKEGQKLSYELERTTSADFGR